MRHKSTISAPFIALALCTGLLSAQDVPDRWNIELEMGLNGASGNSSFTILRTGATVTLLQSESLEFEVAGLVRYGKNEEKVIADDARAGLKLDLWPEETLSPFLFANWSRDAIRKLDARASGGAGGKYTFWSGEEGKASVSAAALFDYQNFQVEPGASTTASESHARWSVMTKLQKKLAEGATFQHVMTYQPAFDQVSDYVLALTHSVTTRVVGNVSLSVEHEYLRDSVPPPGARADDQKFSVLLKVSF